jgi:hypothetical protein
MSLPVFYINPGRPTVEKPATAAAADFAEAIEVAFPMQTEDAVLHWYNAKISVGYKYDLSVIVEDIVDMLEFVTSAVQGTIDVAFPSDTFSSTWKLECSAPGMVAHVAWESLSRNERAAAVAQPRSVSLSRQDFSAQWLKLLEVAVRAVRESGVEIADRSLLRRASALLEAV